MALGEDEVVVVGQVGLVEVIPKVPGGEDRYQIGRGHAGGRVPRPRFGARADPIDADLLGNLAHEVERRKRSCVDTAGHRHGCSSVLPSELESCRDRPLWRGAVLVKVVWGTVTPLARAYSSVRIERLTTDQKVGGSNPPGRATPDFVFKSWGVEGFLRAVRRCIMPCIRRSI